jgi:hypothetical protein
VSTLSSKQDRRTFLLVDATHEELIELRKAMPDWLWVEAPEGWPLDVEAKVLGQPFDAVIVFARKDRDEFTLAACRRICQEKAVVGRPVLVAGTRYQMNLAHELRRLHGVDFVFTPIDEDTLLDKIKEADKVPS